MDVIKCNNIIDPVFTNSTCIPLLLSFSHILLTNDKYKKGYKYLETKHHFYVD